MPLGLWARMGPRNRVLHGGPDSPWEGAILGKRVAHCKVYGLSAVCCANRLHQARRGWLGMPGHVGQNDTVSHFCKMNWMHLFLGHCGLILQLAPPFLTNFWCPQPLSGRGDELNAPISRPLRPNFAIGPPNFQPQCLPNFRGYPFSACAGQKTSIREYSDQTLRADRYYGGAGACSQEFMTFCIVAAWERGKIYGFLLSFHTVDFVLALLAAAKRM